MLQVQGSMSARQGKRGVRVPMAPDATAPQRLGGAAGVGGGGRGAHMSGDCFARRASSLLLERPGSITSRADDGNPARQARGAGEQDLQQTIARPKQQHTRLGGSERDKRGGG